ncbi:hypothetical protein, partial [Serratia marcescens]|uniref:hypothetical protein n=1 Tax=Serratia marcescens TaxID=615 RepID=UPI001954F33F
MTDFWAHSREEQAVERISKKFRLRCQDKLVIYAAVAKTSCKMLKRQGNWVVSSVGRAVDF